MDTETLTQRITHRLWATSGATVVDSPPGAGKTALIVSVVSRLRTESNLTIIVATPTRRGAADLCERLLAATPGIPLASNIREAHRLLGVEALSRLPGEGRTDTIIVTTVASAAARQPIADIFVFDEAYQSTFSEAASAAENADSLLLVGDPGQIGPVVVSDTAVWDDHKMVPHRRAPEVFATFDDCETFHLRDSFRLGPESVGVIAPLYDFEFGSKRPSRHLAVGDKAFPAIEHIAIRKTTGVADPRLPMAIADRIEGLLDREACVEDESGSSILGAEDIAVVVSHNIQQMLIEAELADRGLDDVAVGTADGLQGGQWPVVVAADPLIGHGELSAHQLSLGRLCVMLSRHTTHLTWLHDPASAALLRDEDSDQAHLARQVRAKLLKTARRARVGV